MYSIEYNEERTGNRPFLFFICSRTIDRPAFGDAKLQRISDICKEINVFNATLKNLKQTKVFC